MKFSLAVLLLTFAPLISIEVNAQSKKQQIDILNQEIDSLKNELLKQISLRQTAEAALSSSSKNISEQHEKIKKLELELKKSAQTKDSLNILKNELKIIMDFVEWFEIFDFNDITTAEIGKIVIFSRSEYKYVDGEPNEYYNGDKWLDIMNLYYVRSDGALNKVDFSDCFNSKINILLEEINSIAKRQFIEDQKIVEECGGDLKLPLKLTDLEMHVNENEVCFEYDVGTWKGNNCGSPRDVVCFESSYVLQFLK